MGLAVAGFSAPSAAETAAPAADAIVIPAPPKGKGEVVFFRSGTFIGGGISCAVSEGGKKVSSLPPGEYFIAVADPGKHSYAVSSEVTNSLNLEVEADEVQYADCHVKMGILAGRPVLAPATVEAFTAQSHKGLKMVSASRMGEGALRPDGTTSSATAPAATPAAPK